MSPKPHLSSDDFRSLSDQKAQDWRTISDVNPTLFGVAGALFAAGVAKNLAWVTVMSPIPLFLGVLHMVRGAKLQLPMITYLATHPPKEGASWEADIARVRPRVWRQLAGRMPDDTSADGNLMAQLRRPSAWNTWLLVAVVTGVVIDVVAALANEKHACVAVPAGLGFLVLLTCGAVWQASTIESDRAIWQQAWKDDVENAGI